jgi:hypothetical protein
LFDGRFSTAGSPSLATDFNFDFAMSQPEEMAIAAVGDMTSGPPVDLAAECGTKPAGYLTEAPGPNAFAVERGVVYHT